MPSECSDLRADLARKPVVDLARLENRLVLSGLGRQFRLRDALCVFVREVELQIGDRIAELLLRGFPRSKRGNLEVGDLRSDRDNPGLMLVIRLLSLTPDTLSLYVIMLFNLGFDHIELCVIELLAIKRCNTTLPA